MLALKHGSVDVSELAERFDVTTETIRRDLSDLQERQLLRRVHGGAVPFERRDHEPMVDAREMLNAEEKLRIGREATLEVPERGSVDHRLGLDRSALRRGVPRRSRRPRHHQLADDRRHAASVAASRKLTVLGGGVRTNTFAMVDASTVDAVRNMSVDVLFISCDGLSFGRGLTTPVLATKRCSSAP